MEQRRVIARPRPWWGALVLVTVALASTGCESAPTPGAVCTRSSECGTPLVCSYGRCRAECVETRDCPIATRCLSSDGIGVCSLDVENHCDTHVCPSPLQCVADQCRTECSSDADCFLGRCVMSTCVEPQSGIDAGTPDDVGGHDAGSQIDAGAGECLAASPDALRALLGTSSTTHGLRASTTHVTDVTGSFARVLALAALQTSADGPAVYVATTEEGAPQIHRASIVDGPLVFARSDLFAGVNEVWSIDLSSSGGDLIAMLERQPIDGSDAFAWAHDDLTEPALDMAPLTPGMPIGGTTYHGATAIVGGSSPFGGDVPVFHVFHDNDGAMTRLGAVDRGRGVGTYRSLAPLPTDFAYDLLEMTATHGPLVAVRDPSSGVVGYWRPDQVPGAPLVELARATTALPGLAASLDGTISLFAWASGTGVDLTRVRCGGSTCDVVVPRGHVADGSSAVERVAITAVAEGYVLAVGRGDGTVDVHRVDDSGASPIVTPFADIAGASGSSFVPPMPLGDGAMIRELSVSATPTPEGAAIVVAVMTELDVRRVWTASFLTCPL